MLSLGTTFLGLMGFGFIVGLNIGALYNLIHTHG